MQPTPTRAAVSPLAAQFAARRYVVIPGLVAPQEAKRLADYLDQSHTEGRMSLADPFVPQTPCTYGDRMLEQLLGTLGPWLEFYTGLALYPTYSFARIYKKGDELTAHRDREACEVSISLNLGQEPDEPWPLWLRDHDGNDFAAILRPGDALIYRGIELAHWREHYAGEKLSQVFLHYVDRNGPHAEEKFDHRPGLGEPSVQR